MQKHFYLFLKKKIVLLLSFLSIVGHSQEEEFDPLPEIKVYNQGTSFTSVTVDKNKNIWAGTLRQGLFFLNRSVENSSFVKQSIGNISSFWIKTLAADSTENVWVGHAGTDLNFSGGGIDRININTFAHKHLVPDVNTKGLNYSAGDGLGTRNALQIVVDPYNNLNIAHGYHGQNITSSGAWNTSYYVITPGTFSTRYAPNYSQRFYSVGTWYGAEDQGLPFPAYTYDPPPLARQGTRNCYSISADEYYVWVVVEDYETDQYKYPSRILQYSFNLEFLGWNTISLTKLSGNLTSVYSNLKNVWVGSDTVGDGFSVLKDGEWHRISSSELIPPGTRINRAAIWGDKSGRVYIGTTKGLIVYNGYGDVASVNSYMLYTKEKMTSVRRSRHLPEMVSNNIITGAMQNGNISWLATDNGIMSLDLESKVYLYHIQDKSKPELENVEILFGYGYDTVENHTLFSTLEYEKSNYPKNVKEEQIPTFAVDRTKSTLFRYKTSDFEGVHEGRYKFELRKDEKAEPEYEEGTEEYKNLYGDFSSKELRYYGVGVNNSSNEIGYVDLIFEHPGFIKPEDFKEGKNYAEYEFLVWYEEHNQKKPELIFKHPVKISIPPVLLLHGVWTEMSVMKPLENYLTSEEGGGFSENEVLKVWREAREPETPYEGYSSILYTKIRELRESALKGKISAGKVNVIGHSRGGTDARAYIEEIDPMIKYNDDINSLITLNAPHSGSHAATAQFDPRIFIEEYKIPNSKNNPVVDKVNELIISPFEKLGPVRIKDVFSLPLPSGEKDNRWGAKYLFISPGEDLLGGAVKAPELEFKDNIQFINRLNRKENIAKLTERVPIHTVATTFKFCEAHEYFCREYKYKDLDYPTKVSEGIAGMDLMATVISDIIYKTPEGITEGLIRSVDDLFSALYRQHSSEFLNAGIFQLFKDPLPYVKNDIGVSYTSMTGGLKAPYMSDFEGDNIAHSQIFSDYGFNATGVAYSEKVHNKIKELLKQNPRDSKSSFYSNKSETGIFGSSFNPKEEKYYFELGNKIPLKVGEGEATEEKKGKIIIDPHYYYFPQGKQSSKNNFDNNDFEITSGDKVNFNIYQEDINKLLIHYKYPGIDGIFIQSRSNDIKFENTFEFEIPKEFFGEFTITAYGINENGLVSMHTVTPKVKLPENVKLESIRFSKEKIEIQEQASYDFIVLGMFSDGVERYINDLEGLNFVSDDSEIIKYEDKNIIKALKPGQTVFKASIGELTAELNIDVFINYAMSKSLVINFYPDYEKGSPVTLNWETYQEVGSDYFILERSENTDQNFTEINRQQAKGTIYEPQNYSFTDNTPANKVYYRITLYNLDREAVYTQIIELEKESGSLSTEEIPQWEANQIKLAPNPTHTNSAALYIKSSNFDGNATVNIYDLSGQLVSTKNCIINKGEQKIEISIPLRLPNGIYLIQLRTKNYSKTLKLILDK